MNIFKLFFPFGIPGVFSYVETWDETKPAGSRNANLGDDDIREYKRAMRERLAGGGMHFPSTDDANAGLFDNVKFIEQAANPTQEANRGFLFTKDVAAVTELYWMDSGGNVVQLTTGGKVLLTSLSGWVARGDLIRGGASAWERHALGASGTVLKSDGTDALFGLISTAPRAAFSNLKVVRDSATQVTVTADDLTLYDSSNNAVVIHTVSEAIAITTAGVSGLDTGAEAANTIYYIWIIRKSSDGTVNGLLSTSATAPTMPAGYDQKALVGAVGNDNSSNFIDFVQEGRYYYFTTSISMASGNVGIGSWTTVDLTPATLTYFVPSALSTRAFGELKSASGTTLCTNRSGASITVGTANTLGNNSNYGGNIYWEFSIITTDSLYLASNDGSSDFLLGGFVLNKL